MESFKSSNFEKNQYQFKPWSYEEFIQHQNVSELSVEEQEEWIKNPDPDRKLYSLYLENFYGHLENDRRAYSLFLEHFYTDHENSYKIESGKKAPSFEEWIVTQK